MKYLTNIAVLVVVLLFISGSSANCSSYKRDVLGKRNYYRKCPCAIASASFDTPRFTGFVSYAQDECGDTTVFGQYYSGFANPTTSNYSFSVVDDCGNQLQDLGTLGGVQFTDVGGTKPFAQKFNFPLNCDGTGILLTKSAVYKKRNCHATYRKRAAGDGGSYMDINSNGASQASAGIGGY